MSSRGRQMVEMVLDQASSTSNHVIARDRDVYDIAKNNVNGMELENGIHVEYQSVDALEKVEHESVEMTENVYEDDEPFQDSGSEYIPSEEENNSRNNMSIVETSDEEGRNQQLVDEEHGLVEGRKRSRKSKGQGDPANWKRAKNSSARLKGDAYIGFKRDASGKYKQIVEKEKRKLGQRCDGHTRTASRGPRQKFECTALSEEERKSIFNHFWSLNSWEAKKVLVSTLVSYTKPKCRRKSTLPEESRKQIGFQYHLITVGETEKLKRLVCKKMFLATLGIKEKTVRLWRLENGSCSTKEQNKEAPPPMQECSKNVREFLDSLPRVESHYCRASSKKLYLEPIWNSYRHLYREFLHNCEVNQKRSCSWRTFLKTFRSMNLEIHTPKKDQCNSCLMYKNGNLPTSVYEKHIKRKDEARKEKTKDKQSAAEENTCVYTVDLQAVLVCPRLLASAIYYKTKLKVHNLTFYNMKNKDVTCYLWHESSGGLESDVFTSIMVKFLKNEIQTHQPSRVVLWSDGCCYQNRNTKLSNGFLELATAENVTIEQKYLEVGHTQMEVDSIHSAIERKLRKGREICVPADYVHIIKSARQNPSPYKVIQLTYRDFDKRPEGLYTSLRPGSKKGDPCVTDICALQHKPEGIINYKLNFDETWQEIPRRPKRNSSKSVPPYSPLYNAPCPIELTKFIHLQELKSLISDDYHEFYNKLSHNCGSDECTHIRAIAKPKQGPSVIGNQSEDGESCSL